MFALFFPAFVHPSRRAEDFVDWRGALLGAAVVSVCIWAFFRCPLRRWIPKALTLVSVIVAVYCAWMSVGSYLISGIGR
jgi:hypothetical protein